jgi:hypothetical protein
VIPDCTEQRTLENMRCGGTPTVMAELRGDAMEAHNLHGMPSQRTALACRCYRQYCEINSRYVMGSCGTAARVRSPLRYITAVNRVYAPQLSEDITSARTANPL